MDHPVCGHQERQFIAEYFAGKCGRFLEFGAFDGVTDSLVKPLIDDGWSGVQVEPSPVNFCALADARGGNPRLSLVNAAVGARGGLTLFHEAFDRQLCGLSPRKNRSYCRSFYVHTLAVGDLLAAFGGPLGWRCVVIDTEGNDLEILAALPLAEMLDNELLCVELNSDRSAVLDLLAPHYAVLLDTGINLVARRKT